MKQIVAGLTLCALTTLSVHGVSGQSQPKVRTGAPLVIGWHDEMNDPALWHPLGVEDQPDVYTARKGSVTLRLPHVPQGFPYAFQWSGVTRTISADLGRFPVLMARVGSLEAGSYTHLDVEERDMAGRVMRSWRSPTLTHPGLTFVDLGKEIDGSVRRLTLRLIIGGKLTGAKGEYDWVRFVPRASVPLLQEVPDWQNVTSTEPSGDAPTLPVAAAGANTTRLARMETPLGQRDTSALPAPRRIRFELRDIAQNLNAPQQQMDFFVHTGSLDAPLVTLADNGGFPDVLNVYARPKTINGLPGVLVSLILVRASVVPASASFALNLWQPFMPGPCTLVKVTAKQVAGE